jgi:RsiW-degrading membrane proteinase PrsW (M82 family)
VSFFECILWMIPLLIWDLIFLLAIQPHLKDTGLSGTAILAYFINFYFFAGFCEELVKYFVIRRILNSLLTPDWRSMLVYGICAGAGFACTENILYVFSGGYATAVVRAALSVPLHCTTGAIIGMSFITFYYYFYHTISIQCIYICMYITIC